MSFQHRSSIMIRRKAGEKKAREKPQKGGPPKCKNVGTVWSLAERRGNIGEPGSIGGVVPGGGMAGKIGGPQQQQRSTAAAHQRRVSDTTTGRGRRK